MSALSNCIHLVGVSVLSYCLSHRTPSFDNSKQWSGLSWGRICVILVLFDSWIFVFFSGVLVNGVGLSYSHTTCALAIYACITFYALSKILIYAFLVEKVYIVWSGGNRTPRFHTPAYRICAVVLLGYVAVIVLMILGKNSLIRPDGVCVIGLRNFATIAVISYDLLLNVFLTAMFLWPLWRSKLISHRLRKVATRTLYGAIASLTTSAVNMAILVILRGKEYGWVCLGSCVTDVTLNAIVLSWVSAGSYSQHTNITFDRFSLPTMDISPLAPDAQQGEPLPDAYYDYIPREVPARRGKARAKHWLGRLGRLGPRRARRAGVAGAERLSERRTLSWRTDGADLYAQTDGEKLADGKRSESGQTDTERHALDLQSITVPSTSTPDAHDPVDIPLHPHSTHLSCIS